MKNRIKKYFIGLSIVFWSNVVLFSILLVGLLLVKGPEFASETQNSVIFERWAIILTLATIPGALKLFHFLLNKIQSLPLDVFLKKYGQIFLLRMVILDIAGIVNIIGFYIYENLNFVYMSILIIFALFFCCPNKNSLLQVTENDIKNK